MTENVNEITEDQELTSYTSESDTTVTTEETAERPALTQSGQAVGRRKRAIARVRLVPGTGTWKVNGRELDSYFPNKLHQQEVNDPFRVLNRSEEHTSELQSRGHL